MLTRPIECLEGGLPGRLAVNLIGMAGAATAPVHHRLYWRFCDLLGHHALSLARGSAVVRLTADCRMKVFLSDPYWSRLIAASFEYEPDFKRVLRQLAKLDYAFVDCGANFGYWSILVSGRALGSHPTLAIEASRENFEILWQNCELNANRFAIRYNAISDANGTPVQMETRGGHSGAYVRPVGDSDVPVVLTTTLDAVVHEHFQSWPRRLLVKLDVEGQEINAFKGANELLSRDVLFYYEDHGKDRDSTVTRFVLDELGLSVFYCPPTGPPRTIESVDSARRVKTQKTYGYNFLACKPVSEFIDALAPLFGGGGE